MIEMINSRSQFSNFSITNILGEEEGENGIDRNGEMISRIKQEKIDILGIPTTILYVRRHLMPLFCIVPFHKEGIE